MVNRILIVAKNTEIAQNIKDLLKNSGYINIDKTTSANEARQKLAYVDYDIMIINTPLSDEFGIELVLDVSDANTVGIILLVKNELQEQVQEKLEGHGAFCMAKPVKSTLLLQSIQFVDNSRRTITELRQKNEELEQKIRDTKIINRAKVCLVANLKMSEDAAHRYMQKQAMDLRVSQIELAQNIIKTYEM